MHGQWHGEDVNQIGVKGDRVNYKIQKRQICYALPSTFNEDKVWTLGQSDGFLLDHLSFSQVIFYLNR